jgi:hypothetical protein
MTGYNYAQAKRDMDAYRKAVGKVAHDTAREIIYAWEPYDEKHYHPDVFGPAMERITGSIEEAIERFLGECLAEQERSEDDSSETQNTSASAGVPGDGR